MVTCGIFQSHAATQYCCHALILSAGARLWKVFLPHLSATYLCSTTEGNHVGIPVKQLCGDIVQVCYTFLQFFQVTWAPLPGRPTRTLCRSATNRKLGTYNCTAFSVVQSFMSIDRGMKLGSVEVSGLEAEVLCAHESMHESMKAWKYA